MEKTKLDLGIGGGGRPGKTLLVKGSGAADYAVLRDVYGFNLDPITKDTLIFTTIDSAIGACRASLGDTIYVAPGHTETLATAGAITLDVAGVEIIGLGVGGNRPVLTFSATGSTFLMTANNCKLKNIIGTPSVDSVVAPFIVSGNDCEIDIEWKDASAAVEALRAIRLDTADNCTCKLFYKGFTAGNAVVNGITIDDCDNVRVDIDAYGLVTTAWVNMVDAASTNVVVKAKLYTQGITNFSRDVVDTIGGSTWYADIEDLSGAIKVSGGSAAALASDDITALASAIDAVDNMLDSEFPIVATAVGTVADAELADTVAGGAADTQSLDSKLKGVLQRIGADDANNAAATTLVGGNRDGSILERLEDLRQNSGYSTGLVLQGTCDVGMAGSTTTIVCADLAGQGNDFFNSKYYMQVLLNVNSVGNAPEFQVRLITDYVSATGTFTTDAFTVNVEASDEILVIHESLVALGRDDANNVIATTNVVANADGSVLERLEVVQQAVGGTDTATNVLGADNNNNAFASTNVAPNVDGSVLERLEDLVVKVTAVDDYIDSEVATLTGYHTVVGADSANNAQMRDVIGNKTDTNAGNSLAAKMLIPTADVVTNVNMRDVVGSKADAGATGDVSATESLMAYAKQAVTELSGGAGIGTFPASALPANGVSIAEVLREAYDQEDKAVTNTTAVLVDNTTIFTIAGGPIEILSLVARCVSGNDATASTLQWSANPTDGAAATFSGASGSLANALAGAMVILQGTALGTAPIVNATGVGLGQTVSNGIVIGAGIITTVIGVGSTTGTWQHHLRYRPLARGVTIT